MVLPGPTSSGHQSSGLLLAVRAWQIQMVFPPRALGAVKGLPEVSDDIFHIFQADAQADQVRGNAGGAQLLVGELAVGVGGRMQHAGVAVCHVGFDGDQLQGIQEAVVKGAAALQAEAHDAAAAVRKILEGQAVVGELVVNKKIAADVLEIMRRLFKESYPIERVRLISPCAHSALHR